MGLTSRVGGQGVSRHQPRQAGWRQGRGGGLKDEDQSREVIGVFGILFPSLGAIAYHIKRDSTAETRQRRARGN